MKQIQEAVRAYLEEVSGIHTVSNRSRVRGEYPLLSVAVKEEGTVLLAGGRMAEHIYQVTVCAASDRERDAIVPLLSEVTLHLLRGIPAELHGEARVLHPLDISTDADTLTFSLQLCMPVPPLPDHESEATHTMESLHLHVPE